MPCLPAGSSQVENIQPFSAKDLSIRSLGDRIRDLGQLRNLYPNIPKDQAFGSHYNSEWVGAAAGTRGGLEGLGPTQVLLAPGGSRCRQRGLAPPGAVPGRWLTDASPLRAEEQTGKDGRGYVSTAIKMTVESERWACAAPRPWPSAAGPGQGWTRGCWAGGFLTGQNGDVLESEEPPAPRQSRLSAS